MFGDGNDLSFPTWDYIYLSSRYDIDSLWSQYSMLSMKSNNSVRDLKALPFWEFKALSKKVTEYLEQENNADGDSSGLADTKDTVSSTMNNQKSMMKNSMSGLKFK